MWGVGCRVLGSGLGLTWVLNAQDVHIQEIAERLEGVTGEDFV